MTPKQREAFRARLQTALDEALAAGPHKIEPNRKDPSAVGVADEDEQALGEMMQTLASKRNEAQAARAGDIRRAMRKLAESPDEYGLCEECDEEIPPRRLEVMPWAPLCAECQQKKDPPRGGVRKKLTDYR